MGRAQEDRELSKTEHETIHALIRLVPEDFADSAAEITNALSRQGSPYRLTPQDLFDLAGLMLGQRPSLSPDLVTRTGAQTHGHVTFAEVSLESGRQVFYFVRLATQDGAWRLCGDTTRAF